MGITCHACKFWTCLDLQGPVPRVAVTCLSSSFFRGEVNTGLQC